VLDLSSMDCDELCLALTEAGFPAYRSRQLWDWVHKKGETDFAKMTNLPADLREFLVKEAMVTAPQIIKEQVSANGDTVKLLLAFADGVMIEVVGMFYNRYGHKSCTVCLSTQAGCTMGCAFCATALGGWQRNLSAGEIIAQVLAVVKWRGGQEVSNLVYMGMGEPLLNLAAVLKSVYILHRPEGQNISMRKITISTCGLVPQIDELAAYKLPLSLAVSLHAADDELRTQLMPINKHYPLHELLSACDRYTKATGRRITYEYALFRDVNDRQEDAVRLGNLLRGRLAHINIIAANLVPETGFRPSGRETISKFISYLTPYGIEVTARQRRGTDIDAACGQLRGRYNRESEVKHAD